jgi:hypothetical protein
MQNKITRADRNPSDQRMKITTLLTTMSKGDVQAAIAGLPRAQGYELIVKPLRYRSSPHLAAFTSFEDRRITLQIPEPFFPFREIIHYGAKRLPGKGMKFTPLGKWLILHSRIEVARFLYCHEWYHWYLYEALKKPSSAETACDRFALQNFRKRVVTMEDARAALRRVRRPEASAKMQSGAGEWIAMRERS